jgi:hypothetical protein
MQQCDDGPDGVRGTGTARHTPKPFSRQKASTNPESPHKRRNGQPVACLLASGETAYRRSALAGSCMLRCINESLPPTPLRYVATQARGVTSLGSRAAAPVLHIHPGQVPGFLCLGGLWVRLLELQNGEAAGDAGVPRSGRVLLIDINRRAISTC